MPIRIAASLFALSLALTACGDARRDTAGGGTPGDTAMAGASDTAGGAAPSQADEAEASMRDAAGRELGTVALTGGDQGIRIEGKLSGLPPGEHAIHLHTTGRCEPPFESAGDHWNPTQAQHGTKSAKGPHLGDLPNLIVGPDSSVNVETTTPGGTLSGQNGLLDTTAPPWWCTPSPTITSPSPRATPAIV